MWRRGSENRGQEEFMLDLIYILGTAVFFAGIGVLGKALARL